MPLFRKSHKKDDRFTGNTATGPHDQNLSGSGPHNQNLSGPGVDPNFVGYSQPGMNNSPVSGYAPSRHPYPNEANYPGTGNLDQHSKPSKFGGKVQTAIGTMVGSESLRAKGMEKEQEARQLNSQSNALAQAESLEREAQMHRDRAMGGGDRNLMDNNADRRFNY